MAFGGETSLGATGDTSPNQAQLDLTTVAALNAGEFVVVVVGVDNFANGGDDLAVASVTLGVGGQALTKAIQIANGVAAQGGASCSIWYGKANSTLASGGIIRATFTNAANSDASAMTARKWTIGAGKGVAIDGTPGTLVNNTGADPGSLDVTTSSGLEGLRVRGIASQVGNNTNLTPTASWNAWANGNSATSGTTAEICARAESRIVTAANAASDPTYVSAIYASAYVVFKETNLIVMTCTPLAVAFAGVNANFDFALTMTATPLAVSVSGPNTALKIGRVMIADSTAINVTMNQASLVVGRRMIATVRQFTVTGQSANLRSAYRILASPLPVLVTGQSANLIIRTPVHTVMQAQMTQVYVGTPVAMLYTRKKMYLNFGTKIPIVPGRI